MPERVKRFNIGKVTNSRQKDLNGDSTKEEKSKSSDLSNKNEIDQLSNPNITDNNYSHIHLDNINLKIIEELLNNGDIKSSEIATKLAIPLSTIQRRRSMLEKYSVLEKTYTLDPKKLGLRISEISINTKKGNSHEVMKEIYKSHRRNIVDMSLRIGDPDTNISFRIVYKNSVFLFNLLEEIKENEMVNGVSWSEYISEKKNNQSSFVDLFSS
ncbi:winged helix-turn-helix transcriptional regulator [Candidatus Nitrosocosmicus sp. R]